MTDDTGPQTPNPQDPHDPAVSDRPADGSRATPPDPGVSPDDTGSTWGQDALRSSMGMTVPGQGSDGAGSDPHGAVPQGSDVAADTGVGQPIPGGGRSTGPTGRRVGPRPIRGPRFSGGPLVAGLGLLSLLVTIAIMAILMVRVIDGTRGTSVTDVAGPTVADDGGAEVDEPAALDAANAASCRIDKQTIETAVSVYEAMEGDAPTSIADLVETSLLREDPGGFELRSGDSGAEVVGVDRCEGTS